MIRDLEAHRRRAALDHAVGIDAVHRFVGEHAAVPHGGAEEGALAAVADAGRVEIRVQIGFERVMRWHLMALAAFFMEPDPPTLALGVVVVDAHVHHGADAGEGEGHHADQRPIAQPDHRRGVYTVEQRARLFRREHGGFTAFHHMCRPAYRMRRVGRDNAARHQPVEQHPDGGQVLFDRGLRDIPLQALDIGCHMQWLDHHQLAELVVVTPGKKPNHSPVIGHAGVFVPDGGQEEFEEAPYGLVAGVGDHRRDEDAHRGRSDRFGLRNGYECIHGASVT